MRLLTGLIIFLFSLSLSGQSFNAWISEGDSSYDNKDYPASAQAYQKAFEIQEGSASHYYNAACSSALAGMNREAIRYLALSVEKGWINVSHMKNDSDLNSLHKAEEWKGILSNAQANLDEYEKDLDKPLKDKLEKIYIRDQTLRQLYRDAEEKFGKDSDEMQYFWQLVSEEDRKNEKEVIAIIDSVGWPGKSRVGGKANAATWLVIQHAPLEIQEKYLPLLRKSVMKGESRGSDLALLEDRIQMRNGLPQTYGSQVITDEETGSQKVYEIKDPEYVNQRRASVGLGPIQDYLRRWEIEWTIEQKEKN